MQLCILGLVLLFGFVQVAKLQQDQPIKHVHMIFMNHLDVGYDGLLPEQIGFINNILNKYFNVYFPRAIQVATELLGLGYYEKLILHDATLAYLHGFVRTPGMVQYLYSLEL
ncbi:uncharacterized protein [Argopecten irradians]|uniref:uncharacterized protein n=1 Tax=Argopecten irradians TaxID=31199 RepID=UPI00371D24AB